MEYPWNYFSGERGGSVVECRTPEREVRGSRPTAAVLCPWARHFTPRKYWLITQEAMAPSRHDWKFVDWDVKPQNNHYFRIEMGANKYRKGIRNSYMLKLIYGISRGVPIDRKWCKVGQAGHVVGWGGAGQGTSVHGRAGLGRMG